MDVGRARADELVAAASVWERARSAGGSPLPLGRLARVPVKLADPEALVVVVRIDDAVVAMAQLEAHRSLPHWGHVSMVFVDPLHQGRGVGRALMETAHVLAADVGWRSTSLWTRESNARAQALYRAVGYRATDEVEPAPSGELARRWSRLDQREASASAEATR